MLDLILTPYFALYNHGDFLLFILGLLSFAISLPIGSLLYKKIRSQFPVKVNCWFCNKDSHVPYNNANCFDCPYCDQYNGFNKDGGYNKQIQEQFTPNLNTKIYTTLKTSSKKDDKSTRSSNGLCKMCNNNQQLKIKQLALFVPLSERNYDVEIEEYRKKLEKSYQLCSNCEIYLKETLLKQQYNLLTDRLNTQKVKPDKGSLMKDDSSIIGRMFPVMRYSFAASLRWISISVILWLLLVYALYLETEFKILKTAVKKWISVDLSHPILKIIVKTVQMSHNYKKELTAFGLMCSLLSSCIYNMKLKLIDVINIMFWGFLLSSMWNDFIYAQVSLLLVCLVLNSKAMQDRRHCFYKRIIKKRPSFENYHPAPCDVPNAKPNGETIPPEVKNKCEEPSVTASDFPETETQEFIKLSHVSTRTRTKNYTDKQPQTIQPTIQSTIFSKSFLAGLDVSDSKTEDNEVCYPSREIHDNLSNLNLGSSKLDNPSKPSNYLFETHDFTDKCKNNSFSASSLIKPAKFVKSSINSWSCGEIPESVSRSSTPSSGFSSQRTEKSEYNRNYVPYSKAISPVSHFGRVTPENLDCYDENPNFFNPVNYFSPSFVPFQHFTGPIGHTTVYTYTRPTNYPFGFSAPSQVFNHSPKSRFSDISDSENIFQNTSQNLQRNRKWQKFKSYFYNTSIFLNLFTIVVLAYSVFSGLILIDWKVPTFSFNS